MTQERKFVIQEVDAVASPPRARVDDGPAARQPDYLEGFLSEKPQAVSANEPGGDLYEGVVAALRDIFDPEIPVNIYDLGLIYKIDINPIAKAPCPCF